MGSISACFDALASSQGKELMEHYVKRVITLRMNLNNNLENIRLLDSDDPSKLVFLASDGRTLFKRMLDEYNIQFEMGMPGYALAMTSLADTKEMYTELSKAIRNIDNDFGPPETLGSYSRESLPEMVMVPWRAMEYNFLKAEDVDINKAAGRVVTENICMYPPGIPVVIAGEVLAGDVLNMAKEALRSCNRDSVRCLITD